MDLVVVLLCAWWRSEVIFAAAAKHVNQGETIKAAGHPHHPANLALINKDHRLVLEELQQYL